MDTTQIEIFAALDGVRKLSGSFDKRFITNLASVAKANPLYELSEKQIEWTYRLLYKYRKQLKSLYQQHKNNPFCSKKINVLNMAQ